MGTRSLAINLQMNINLRYSQTVFQGTFGLIKRTFGRIVHFLVVTYCEILNGKDIIRWVPLLRSNSPVTIKTCRLQVQRYA